MPLHGFVLRFATTRPFTAHCNSSLLLLVAARSSSASHRPTLIRSPSNQNFGEPIANLLSFSRHSRMLQYMLCIHRPYISNCEVEKEDIDPLESACLTKLGFCCSIPEATDPSDCWYKVLLKWLS